MKCNLQKQSGVNNMSNIDRFSLKDLKLKNGNREYNIIFNGVQIIQLKGDSSTGKSLLASDIKEQRGQIVNFPNILVIDEFNNELLKLLEPEQIPEYDLIVIDNADILVTTDLDTLICNELNRNFKTYWIIIGRKRYKCCTYELCRGILENRHFKNKYTFSIKYTNYISD